MSAEHGSGGGDAEHGVDTLISFLLLFTLLPTVMVIAEKTLEGPTTNFLKVGGGGGAGGHH